MSTAEAVASLLEEGINIGKAYSDKKNLKALSRLLEKAGYVAGEEKALAEKDPLEASLALVATIGVATLIGTAGFEALAGTLLETAVGKVAQTALQDALVSNFGWTEAKAATVAFNSLQASTAFVEGLIANAATEAAVRAVYRQLYGDVNNLMGQVGADVSSIVAKAGDELSIASASDDIAWPSFNFTLDQAAQNFADGTSRLSTYNPDGSSYTISYSGLNGTGAPTFADRENAQGTSAITTYELDGSTITSEYSKLSGGGNIIGLDQENANGTSVITSYQSDGSSIALTFAGSNGTDLLKSKDLERQNNTSQITLYNADGSSVITEYSGPNGTGSILSVITVPVQNYTPYITLSLIDVEMANGSVASGTVNMRLSGNNEEYYAKGGLTILNSSGQVWSLNEGGVITVVGANEIELDFSGNKGALGYGLHLIFTNGPEFVAGNQGRLLLESGPGEYQVTVGVLPSGGESYLSSSLGNSVVVQGAAVIAAGAASKSKAIASSAEKNSGTQNRSETAVISGTLGATKMAFLTVNSNSLSDVPSILVPTLSHHADGLVQGYSILRDVQAHTESERLFRASASIDDHSSASWHTALLHSSLMH